MRPSPPGPLSRAATSRPPRTGEGGRLRSFVSGLFPTVPRDRVRRWVGILSAYFTAQTLTQLLGIAAGLLLIRFMPVQEFALYTLAFSVVTFFNFLTDLGSTTSLLHFYHRTAGEGTAFEPYFAAVLSLRRAAFLLGAAAVVIAFPYAAAAKGFGWGQIALVTAGILVNVWFQIQASIRVLALRLHNRYGQSYRADVGGTVLRLLLAGLMVVTQQLAAWVGVAATAASTALSALLARPAVQAAPVADTEPAPEPVPSLAPYRRKVVRYLLPTLPSALYFSVQGPLIIWLSATFSSTRTIAEVGALGRLGMVVGMFTTLIGVVFLPRLARIVDERQYFQRFLQFGALLLAVALSLLLFAVLLPKVFLFILGAHYAGLDSELLLVIGGAGLSLLDGYLVSVNIARSWTRWQTAFLIVQVATQAGLIALFPLTSTYNVLLFNFLSAGVACGLQTVICTLGFTRPHWVRWS